MNQQTRRIARGTAVLAVTGLIAAFLHVFACPHSNGGAGIRVTDLAGRKVSIPGEVTRLVTLGPGALRLVTYLDAANRVVGIDAMEKRMARDVYARPYMH